MKSFNTILSMNLI